MSGRKAPKARKAEQSTSLHVEERPTWLRPLVQGRDPRYLQIADQVARAVRQGTLKPGDQVPPQRWLASQLGVDLTTVTRAYAEVRSRGLIASFGGRGSFIAESYSAPRRATVDMAMNVPPLPAKRALADHINSGIENLLRNSGAESVSGYQNPELDSSALQAAKVWLGPMFKAMSGSRVLMCAGAQGAIYNLLLTHTRRGDPVLCDSLTYPGFLRAARALGLKIVGVPRDASGMLPDAIERCRRETGARVLYLNPTIQNPTTCTMPADRRREIAELIHRHDLTLIEDDPYWPLASDAPLPISSYMAGARLLPRVIVQVPIAESASGLCLGSIRWCYIHASGVLPGIRHVVFSIACPPCADLDSERYGKGFAEGNSDRNACQADTGQIHSARWGRCTSHRHSSLAFLAAPLETASVWPRAGEPWHPDCKHGCL